MLVAGFKMLDAAPAIGTAVGVVLHSHGKHWVHKRGKVKAIADHNPVDSASSKGVIAILEDGSWEFYWNLTEMPS